MAWILLNLRRLRDERATAIGFALLVLVTTTLAAGAPRAFDRLGDDTLRAELAQRTPFERNIQFIELDRLPVGAAAPLDTIQAEADAVNETVPREIRALFARRDLLVESIRFSVEKPTNDPTTVRLRIQPAAADRIHLVAGRMPTDAFTKSAEGVVTLEVAISTANATTIGVAVGDTIPLQTDGSDTLAASRDLGAVNATIVGTFSVDAPDDPAWLGDSSLDHPTVRTLGGDSRLLDTSALLAPEAYAGLLAATQEPLSFIRYTFQDYVDPARFRQRDTATLIAAFRRLETRYPAAVAPRGGGGVALRTSIRPFLDSETLRWTTATALLTVAVVGPAAVGAAALGMLAVLAARRRRAALSLSRGRGASVGQVTVASVAEGLVLAVPAAAIGAALGGQVAPADPLLLPGLTAAAVALVAIVLLTLATVPATGGPAFGAGRDLSAPRPPAPRRLVFEGLVVLLAAAGAAALRDRGLRPDGSADPLIAAVPALVGVAAGLIALRAVPYPTRLLARLARLRRGLIGVLAMRRASSGAGAPVLLVLLATTTIGAFSATAFTYLDRSADAAGWQDVGSDFRVVASQDYLQRDFDFAAVPGVQAAARMFTGRAIVALRAASDLMVLDVEAYDEVVRGTPAEIHLPVALYGPAAQPIPIVIGKDLAERAGGLKLGETATISIQGYSFQAKVIEVIEAFPGAPSGAFMLASEKQLRALFPDAPLRPTTAYLRADASRGDEIRTAITSVMSQAVVTGRAERTEALRDAPVVRAVRIGIAATAAVAAIYAALAVAAALALGGAARMIETAHLQTLGMSGRQALVALVLEQGPALAFAFLGGIALGVGLLSFLAPGLQIQRLVGVSVEVAAGLDPILIVAMALGIAGVALIGIGAGLWLGRRLAPIAALRRGFE